MQRPIQMKRLLCVVVAYCFEIAPYIQRITLSNDRTNIIFELNVLSLAFFSNSQYGLNSVLLSDKIVFQYNELINKSFQFATIPIGSKSFLSEKIGCDQPSQHSVIERHSTHIYLLSGRFQKRQYNGRRGSNRFALNKYRLNYSPNKENYRLCATHQHA